jgi:ribose/xylose/arabinose/galactoside ABC-type transport system permease subunit
MPQAPHMTAADLSSRPAPGALARAAAVLTRRNELALILALIVIIAFFAVASPYFFTVRNLTNVLGQASLAMIAGIGVAMVFISGEVDISIGSLQAAVALPLIVIMNNTESLGLGIAGAVGLGLAVGLVNGYLSAYVGINSLIVTLGSLFVLRGGVYLYTGKTAIPDNVGLDSFFALGNRQLLGVIPYPAVIAFGLLVAFMYVMRHRPFGRKVYAVGGNAEVARLAGYSVRRVKFTCFVISALLATVSGILLASRLGSAVHLAGLGFEFQVVAAVVLGGVSLSGGIGSLLGMALGVLILQFLSNGLGMLDLQTEWQLVITGTIIIIAVAFDELKRRRTG